MSVLKSFIGQSENDTEKLMDELTFNFTMFDKEQDILSYLRLMDSSFMKSMYKFGIPNIEFNQVMYLPMIEGINLTESQVR